MVCYIFIFSGKCLQNESEIDPNDGDDSNEIPDIYLPPNKRFWIITSVLGHLTDEDIPVLQERLADIYRIAFTKYDNHLGFNPFLSSLYLVDIFVLSAFSGNNRYIWAYQTSQMTLAI